MQHSLTLLFSSFSSTSSACFFALPPAVPAAATSSHAASIAQRITLSTSSASSSDDNPSQILQPHPRFFLRARRRPLQRSEPRLQLIHPANSSSRSGWRRLRRHGAARGLSASKRRARSLSRGSSVVASSEGGVLKAEAAGVEETSWEAGAGVGHGRMSGGPCWSRAGGLHRQPRRAAAPPRGILCRRFRQPQQLLGARRPTCRRTRGGPLAPPLLPQGHDEAGKKRFWGSTHRRRRSSRRWRKLSQELALA